MSGFEETHAHTSAAILKVETPQLLQPIKLHCEVNKRLSAMNVKWIPPGIAHQTDVGVLSALVQRAQQNGGKRHTSGECTMADECNR